MSLIGVPYRWAGNTPASGFDCSGLVQYVLTRAAEVKLPRTTAEMSRSGETIEPDEIATGDLVFFNTTGRPHSHVGIYVGKLRFVDAPSTGGTVRLDYLSNPYWAKRFDGIRRVAPPREQPTPFDAPTYLASPREMPDESAPVTARTEAERAVPTSGAPDAINAAADAFEPPPAAVGQAENLTRDAGSQPVAPQSQPGVQIMRASATPSVLPAPTSTRDDPIAQFAHGGD